MNDAKVKFGSLSLNNQYQVHFAGFNGNVIQYLKFNKRIDLEKFRRRNVFKYIK